MPSAPAAPVLGSNSSGSSAPATTSSGSPAPTSSATGPATTGGRRRRSAKQASWMAHVKATMRAHRGMKLKDALKMAKKTYKKGMRGGGSVIVPDIYTPGGMAGAGRTRRSRRRGGNLNLY